MLPQSVGFATAILGIIGMLLQFTVYPSINGRLGTAKSYQYFLSLFPLAYAFAPYIALAPSSTPPPGQANGPWVWFSIIVVLFLQVSARTFTLPTSIILLNNCSPHPSVLGTIHGIGQSVSSAFRTIGPIFSGAWYGYGLEESDPSQVVEEGLQYETTDREPLRIALTSVKNLRAAVRSTMHNNLTEMIASHTYVGLVDERRRIAAIQSGVKLYLVDYGMICSEFFYQIGLTDFGNFGIIKLDPAPKLVDLLRTGADAEREAHIASGGPVSSQETTQPEQTGTAEESEIFANAPNIVAKTLIDRREMLNEYFSLQISAEGDLLTIPLLLKGYLPSLGKLPRFLLRLGPYVDWTSEEECFRTFLRELAAFYTPEQLPPPPPEGSNSSDHKEIPESPEEQPEDAVLRHRRLQIARMLEHVVFPALRARLVATTRLLRGVVEVADLKGLYRVFERC